MSTVQLPIKMDAELRDAFISVCKSNDSTASQEIRNFMREYVRKHGQQDLFEIVEKVKLFYKSFNKKDLSN